MESRTPGRVSLLRVPHQTRIDLSRLGSPRWAVCSQWFKLKETIESGSSLQGARKERIMKKTSAKRRDATMRAEYDFSEGVRGKYAKSFQENTEIVVLAPGVAEMFPDSAAVNDALKALVEIAKRRPALKTPR